MSKFKINYFIEQKVKTNKLNKLKICSCTLKHDKFTHSFNDYYLQHTTLVLYTQTHIYIRIPQTISIYNQTSNNIRQHSTKFL